MMNRQQYHAARRQNCPYGQQNNSMLSQNQRSNPVFPTLSMQPKEGYEPNNTPAMAFVPIQELSELYSPEQALCNGTVFPDLNKPLQVGGNCR